MQKENNGFKTRLGFIMAAAGSAIGLGNLWSFPSKTAGNGGAAFVFVYIIMALVIGVVSMIAEMYIGKRSGKNIIDSYKSVGKRFTWIGALGVFSTTIIASYYIVLGGWVLKYTFTYLTSNALTSPEIIASNGYGDYFGAFISGDWQPILFMFIFFAIAMLILIFGVQNGIEKVSKVLMPVLFVLIIVLMIRSLTLGDGVKEGLEFYLKPDFAAMKPKSVLAAMGQSFFSLSLGVGTMCVYGSYAKKHEGLAKSALTVVILDTVVALLAGFMIFPAIYASGMQGAEEVTKGGAGLFFVIMPQIFANMGASGRFFGFLFFFLVFVAAITSIISMVEVALQTTVEKTKIKRPAAVAIFTVVIFAIGCVVSLSMGRFTQLQVPDIFDKSGRISLLDFFDKIIQTYVMPLGTIMACVLVGWRISKDELNDTFKPGRARSTWLFFIRYITPVLVACILIFGMFGWGEKDINGNAVWGFANWRVTLTAVILIAAFVITNQVIVTVKKKKGLYATLPAVSEGGYSDTIIVSDTTSDEAIVEASDIESEADASLETSSASEDETSKTLVENDNVNTSESIDDKTDDETMVDEPSTDDKENNKD